MDEAEKIRRAKVDAAEQAAIAGIPVNILKRYKAAQQRFKARGGCPGCGSLILSMHRGDCPTNKDDLY